MYVKKRKTASDVPFDPKQANKPARKAEIRMEMHNFKGKVTFYFTSVSKNLKVNIKQMLNQMAISGKLVCTRTCKRHPVGPTSHQTRTSSLHACLQAP